MTAIQMIDVHLPTTDGRMLILSRYTQPEPDHQLLLQRLHLTLPTQPPPKISQPDENDATEPIAFVVKTYDFLKRRINALRRFKPQLSKSG